MSVELTVPKISEDADSGTVAEIYVSEGDQIEEGQSIIAVDSDKASVDIPAEQGGTVEGIAISEGDEVKTGDLILKLADSNGQQSKAEEEEEPEQEADASGKQEEEEEEQPQGAKQSQEAEEEPEDQPKAETEQPEEENDEAKSEKQEKAGAESQKDQSEAPQEEAPQPSGEQEQQAADDSGQEEGKDKAPAAASGSGDLEDSPSAPLAKQFARELDIDIHEVPPSGERVTREDVMAYAKKLIQQGGGRPEPSSSGHARGLHPLQLPDFSKFGEVERQPMSKVRSAVATNTLQSWQNMPHVTHHDKAAAELLLEFQQQQELSMTAIIAKIVAAALQRFPKFNATLDLQQEEIIFKHYIHIGVAVDTEDGLLMPVLRDADQKPIHQLSEELDELAQKARNRQLSPEEMQGGNFVVSNLGGIGGTSFTPVIFPPQAAILGVSATQTEAVFDEDGKAKPQAVIPLSLSYDHRLIDGAEAARFVRWLCEVMEQPLRLLS